MEAQHRQGAEVNNIVLRFLHWICRLALGGVFLYSGYVKMKAPLQFAADIAAYKLPMPDGMLFPISQYFPWVEIILGALLLIGWKMRWWGIAASALMLFFITLLTVTYFRGIDANCGCFGSGDKISPLTMLRDSVFLLPALFLAFEKSIRRRFHTMEPAVS
jgi:putative oxidoreductase